MRGVPIPATDSSRTFALPWLGLDKIGKSHPHPDLGFTHALQSFLGPGEPVQVHLVAFGRFLSGIVNPERLDRLLDHQGELMTKTVERPFEVRDPIAIAAE